MLSGSLTDKDKKAPEAASVEIAKRLLSLDTTAAEATKHCADDSYGGDCDCGCGHDEEVRLERLAEWALAQWAEGMMASRPVEDWLDEADALLSDFERRGVRLDPTTAAQFRAWIAARQGWQTQVDQWATALADAERSDDAYGGEVEEDDPRLTPDEQRVLDFAGGDEQLRRRLAEVLEIIRNMEDPPLEWKDFNPFKGEGRCHRWADALNSKLQPYFSFSSGIELEYIAPKFVGYAGLLWSFWRDHGLIRITVTVGDEKHVFYADRYLNGGADHIAFELRDDLVDENSDDYRDFCEAILRSLDAAARIP